MTFLRHVLGFFFLLTGSVLGYLSRWLVKAGAWFVDQESHFDKVDKALSKAMENIYHNKH